MNTPVSHMIHVAAGVFSVNVIDTETLQFKMECDGYRWRFILTERDCAHLAQSLLSCLPDNFLSGATVEMPNCGNEYGLDRSGWAYWVGNENLEKLCFRIVGQGSDARAELGPDDIFQIGNLLSQFDKEIAA